MTFLKRLVLSAALMLAPAAAFAQISINITLAPPALPVYEQPPIPADGYIWTPGYWAYGDDGYYWVPGTWVMAPTPGLLWTPGYWGWSEGVYVFHRGYWGEHIGFYGGVNYGFGYGGSGYEGGRWDGGHFTYNTAVNNVNTTIVHNTYHTTVINNVTVNNVSYNGGSGGIAAQPSAEERAVASEHHVEPTSEQEQHQHAASTNMALRASVNHGSPAVAATARPGVFEGAGVVKARPAAQRFDAAQKPGGEGSPAHNPEHSPNAVRPAGPNGVNQPHPVAPHPQGAPGPRPAPPHPVAPPHPSAPPHQAAPPRNPGEQRPEERHEEHH